jgi:hypothetical protein
MIARRGALRAAVNRRIQFEGSFRLTQDCIALDDIEVSVLSKPKAKAGEAESGDLYRAGSLILLETTTKVKPYDKLLQVKVPAAVYALGTVSVAPLIEPGEPMQSIQCLLTLTKDADLSQIPAFHIYVEGE